MIKMYKRSVTEGPIDVELHASKSEDTERRIERVEVFKPREPIHINPRPVDMTPAFLALNTMNITNGLLF